MRLIALVLLLGGCSSYTTEEPTVDAPEIIASEDALEPQAACLPLLACDAPALDFTPRTWRHTTASPITTSLGTPHHRGRDFFVTPGEPQLVLGHFAYGVGDKDLGDEEVDLFVQTDCASPWTKLGGAATDSDGRIAFEIPTAQRLGAGRHRIRLVVAGDATFADSFLEVVPAGAKIFVADVDGTLTSSEAIEATAMLVGATPATHAGAPEALRALAKKGYRPMYVTARPEMLTQRTHEFLAERGFPAGIVHTSTETWGAGTGDAAAAFKKSELALLAEKGLVPSFGFGNTKSDAEAYAAIPDLSHRVLYKLDGDGRRIDAYAELLPTFAALASECK